MKKQTQKLIVTIFSIFLLSFNFIFPLISSDDVGFENIDQNIENEVLNDNFEGLNTANLDSTMVLTHEDADITIEGTVEDSYSGRNVKILGDVNGDGIDDYIIGSRGEGTEYEGRAYVYFGTEGSFDSTQDLGDNADITIVGHMWADFLPDAITSGDVNGDGFMDIILSTPNSDINGDNTGAVYIFFGSLNMKSYLDAGMDANVTILGSNYGEKFGDHVVSGGDFNNDGKDELLIYADKTVYDGIHHGALYYFNGRSTWNEDYYYSDDRTAIIYSSGYADVEGQISDFGDINGDGYDDFIIGDTAASLGDLDYEGMLFVFLGSSNLLRSGPINEKASFVIRGGVYCQQIGAAVNIVGDINNDGKDDFITYSYTVNSGEFQGEFNGFYGSSNRTNSTLQSASSFKIHRDDGTWGERLIRSAGDVNGDGIDDFAIGIENEIFIFRGKNYQYEPNFALSQADFKLVADIDYCYGVEYSFDGDINNDGKNDLIWGIGDAGVHDWSDYGCSFIFMNFEPYLDEQNLGNFDLTKMHITTFDGKIDDGNFAESVAMVGDVNGDGLGDVLIGAPDEDSYTGNAYLFYGFEGMDIATLQYDEANVTFSGEDSGDNAGGCVAAAGDVNRDGYMDMLIGASGYDNGPESNTGKVYLIYGGTSLSSSINLGTGADATFTGRDAGDQIGAGLAGAGTQSIAGNGDIDGDGYSDFVIGAYNAEASVYTDAGVIYLFSGASGWSADYDLGSGTPYDHRIYGATTDGHVGSSISISGDINNDGYNDILFNELGYSSDKGKVMVIFGSSSLSLNYDLQNQGTADLEYLGTSTGDEFGYSVAIIGDANGDHIDDFLIGNRDSSTTEAYLIYGSESISTDGMEGDEISTKADAIFTHEVDYRSWVSAAGDLNNDGIKDFAIGSTNYTDNAIYVVYGKPSNYSGTISLINHANATYIGKSSDETGYSISGGYDYNGDGRDDLLIGSRSYGTGSAEKGRAWILLGQSTITAPTGVNYLNQSDGMFYGETGSLMGTRAINAGDINGDGINDLVLNAAYLDSHDGAIYIKYGTNLPPEFNAETNISSEYDVKIYDSFQRGEKIGISIASGDFNGDGLNDLLIGAPYTDDYGTERGTAYLMLGDTDLDEEINIHQCKKFTCGSGSFDNYRLGMTVQSAGDINADGYDEILIFAPNAGNGTVHLYYGSAYFVPNHYIEDADVTFEGASSYSQFGNAMASGDINNDGFDDMVFGAYCNDNTGNNAGAAFVVYGNISLNDEYNMSTMYDAVLYGETANDQLGSSLTTGDINGDGIDDIFIASSNYIGAKGKVYGIYGTEDLLSGVLTVNDCNLTINGTNIEQFGYSIDCSGDINNDGYDDLLVGSGYGKILEYGYQREPTYLFYGGTWLQGQITSKYANATFLPTNPISTAYPRVAIIGDINGDNYDDFVINNYQDNLFGTLGGVSYFILGGSTEEATVVNFEIASNIVYSDPRIVYVNSVVTASFDVIDGILSDYTIEWYRGSTHQPEIDGLMSWEMNSSYFWHEDSWQAKLYYTDSFGRSGVAFSWFDCGDSPPVTSNTAISPYQPINSSDLVLTYDYYDADGHALSYANARWYRDGEVVTELNDAFFVPNTMTHEGELWYAEVTCQSGIATVGNTDRSNYVYILPKTDPIITGPEDISMEIQQSREGGTLTWDVYDPTYNMSGRYYSLYRYNGEFKHIIIENASWSNSEPITYEYSIIPTYVDYFLLEVGDGFDGFSTDVVMVDVWDDPPTFEEEPDTVFMTVNDTGRHLIWQPTDDSQEDPEYIIRQNTTFVTEGHWESGELISCSLDGLAPGDYNYSIQFTDDGLFMSKPWVMVHVMNPAPVVSTPADLEFEITSIQSPSITWTPVDTTSFVNGMKYNLTRDGSLIRENLAWTSGTAIDLDLSSLTVGDYTYVLTLSDGLNGTSSDTVEVSITNTNPFVSRPEDMEFEIASIQSPSITWTPVDTSCNTGNMFYNVSRDGTLVRENYAWTSDTAIDMDLSSLNVGDYTYVITLSDGYDGESTDTVEISITNTNPFVSHPADVNFEEESTGHSLTWTMSDSSINSGTFSITKDGSALQTDVSWTNGDSVALDLDDLTAGTYEFVITVEDGYGALNTDTVTVVVESKPASMNPTLGYILLVVGLVAGLLLGFILPKVLDKKKDGRDEESEELSKEDNVKPAKPANEKLQDSKSNAVSKKSNPKTSEITDKKAIAKKTALKKTSQKPTTKKSTVKKTTNKKTTTKKTSKKSTKSK